VSHWIKVRCGLDSVAEVVKLAKILGIAETHALGLLVVFWSFAECESEGGNLPDFDRDLIDRVVRHPGFAAALEQVGWIVFDKRGAIVPYFDRHLGAGAKQRSRWARQKSAQRWKQKAVR
jgi:hypothetical protein